MPKRYWLFKTEPETYSIQDLAGKPRKTDMWEGIRNYQARNFLRDQVKKGDGVLIHHSRIDPPAVVGRAEVVREAFPDPTQFDPRSKYHDPASTESAPRWVTVEVRLVEIFPEPLPMPRLREVDALRGMLLLKKGMRLSIQPVTEAEWKTVLGLAGSKRP